MAYSCVIGIKDECDGCMCCEHESDRSYDYDLADMYEDADIFDQYEGE